MWRCKFRRTHLSLALEPRLISMKVFGKVVSIAALVGMAGWLFQRERQRQLAQESIASLKRFAAERDLRREALDRRLANLPKKTDTRCNRRQLYEETAAAFEIRKEGTMNYVNHTHCIRRLIGLPGQET